jgi:hypothetical protein
MMQPFLSVERFFYFSHYHFPLPELYKVSRRLENGKTAFVKIEVRGIILVQNGIQFSN